MAGRVALVVSASARHGDETFAQARDLLGAAGLHLSSAHLVRDARRLPDVVRRALAHGCDVLVAGGGDGTINCAVDTLLDEGRGRAVTLGVLPLGTANDFARTLAIPSEVEAACTVIAGGHTVAVDVGRVNDAHYVNVASMGLSVEVTQALSPELKRTLGALAYPLSAISAFLRHRPFAATLSFPNGDYPTTTVERLLQVGVGNGRFYGGGLVVAPDAAIDSGALDAYTIELGRKRDLWGVSRYLRSGDFIRTDCVHHYRTGAIRIETVPPLPIDIDGEVGSRAPADFAVVPDAVRVLVPHDAEETAPGLEG